METQPKPIEEVLKSTLETLAAVRAKPITVTQFDESKRRKWLDKWLKIRATNHQLQRLEFEVFNFCRDYAKNPHRGRRLIIFGPNGTGKSHTAKAIYRWACRVAIELPWVSGENGPRLPKAELLNWPMFIKTLHRNFEQSETIEQPELLILDDVGAEHDPNKFSASEIYLALERREIRWTVITTNVLPASWSERFDQRVASRMFRNTTHVDLSDVSDFKV